MTILMGIRLLPIRYMTQSCQANRTISGEAKSKSVKIWRAIRAVVKDDQEADQLLALVKEQSEF